MVDLERHQYAGVPDPQPLRVQRDGFEYQFRARAVTEVRSTVMLHLPPTIEPGLVGHARLFDRFVEQPGEAAVGIAVALLNLGEDVELHAASVLCNARYNTS